MQEGLGGIVSQQLRAVLLQARRQRFFFLARWSYGGGGGGQDEAEQIAMGGLREARELGKET